MRMQSLLRHGLPPALRITFKSIIRPPVPIGFQRFWINALARVNRVPKGVARLKTTLGGRYADRWGDTSASQVILYLHGGAFCAGKPQTHAAFCATLARATGAQVWVPDYRLVPEHPHPAALEDAVAAYRGLLDKGIAAKSIVIAGDSAGGGLALMTAQAIRDRGLPGAAGLVLISPWVDFTSSGESMTTRARRDPMLHPSWARQAVKWMKAGGATLISPLDASLAGLPPTLIQVGSEEILHSDSLRLHARGKAAGWNVELREFEGLWHVFQLYVGLLREADHAVEEIVRFMRQSWG